MHKIIHKQSRGDEGVDRNTSWILTTPQGPLDFIVHLCVEDEEQE